MAPNDGMRKVRSAKHRYVYFCTRNKKLKREWQTNLRYKKEEYPKNKNENYVLGTFLEPEIVVDKKWKENKGVKKSPNYFDLMT